MDVWNTKGKITDEISKQKEKKWLKGYKEMKKLENIMLTNTKKEMK